MSVVSFIKLTQGLRSNLDEHKSGVFCLVLDVVSCFAGGLDWSARLWERRGFRVVITVEEPAEVLAVLCVL